MALEESVASNKRKREPAEREVGEPLAKNENIENIERDGIVKLPDLPIAKTTKEVIQDAPPINSLAGLPIDLLNEIFPLLGLKDRSQVASTCRRLYRMEAMAVKSKQMQNFEMINIDAEQGITMERSTTDSGASLSLNSLTLSVLGSVTHRMLRAMNLRSEKFVVEIDLTDPVYHEVFKVIVESGANKILIRHSVLSRQDSRGTITSEFVDAFPWNVPSAADSYLKFNNVQIHPSAMRKLYEKARDSSFAYVEMWLPMDDAAAFGKEVIGIDGLSLIRGTDAMTYRHARHRPYQRKDGQRTMRIKRESHEIMHVKIGNHDDMRN